MTPVSIVASPRGSNARAGPRRAGVGDEGGEVTTTTLIFPVVLFVILVAVQFALAFHAKSVVTAAAQDGARAAQAEGATGEAGRVEAARFVADNAARLLEEVTVSVDADGDGVHVEVRGEVANVVPGFDLHVTGVADGVTERFRAEDER